MKFLVTGGYGFIGSAFIRNLLNNSEHEVLNLDKLTYAANIESLGNLDTSPNYHFQKGDICDKAIVNKCFESFKPDLVINFAAETHVDRSIVDPRVFVETNVNGTLTLLEASKNYWDKIKFSEKGKMFRFHQISTDEVFGDLQIEDQPFVESSCYSPSSPYSASKASADHLVQAWGRTFGLPYIITNCSNNFGPYQNQEKLIPKTIKNAVHHQTIPIFGEGNQIRDWIFVDDHVDALLMLCESKHFGQNFLIGTQNEKNNLYMVRLTLSILSKINKQGDGEEFNYLDLIEFVKDRPGHDARYGVNPTKIKKITGWSPTSSLEKNLETTVKWYLNHYSVI